LTANTYYRLPWLGYQFGMRNPATAGQFRGLLTERFSYQGIGRRLIVATALWLLKLRKDEKA